MVTFPTPSEWAGSETPPHWSLESSVAFMTATSTPSSPTSRGKRHVSSRIRNVVVFVKVNRKAWGNGSVCTVPFARTSTRLRTTLRPSASSHSSPVRRQVPVTRTRPTPVSNVPRASP